MTPEAKMAYAEQRVQREQPDYASVADDLLFDPEGNSEKLDEFLQWAFGNSEAFCEDAGKVMIAAIRGGRTATLVDEIGRRNYPLLVKFLEECDK